MDPTDFIYPLSIALPSSNPHNPQNHELLPEDWQMPLQQVVLHIDTLLTTHHGRKCIPVGTKLYHGSLEPSLDFKNLLDYITFFGIDVVISLWYILELQGDSEPSELMDGTLYEFVVTRPIPVEILTDLYQHPKETDSCVNQPIGCIHPQISFHGDSYAEPPYDLSIEFTLNLNKDEGRSHGPFKDYIALQKVYTVDTRILFANKDKSFDVFNPVDAITRVVVYTGRRSRNRKTRRKKSRTAFCKKR